MPLREKENPTDPHSLVFDTHGFSAGDMKLNVRCSHGSLAMQYAKDGRCGLGVERSNVL